MSDNAVMVTETGILWRNLEATLMFHTEQKVTSSQATLRFDEYCENASTHTHTHTWQFIAAEQGLSVQNEHDEMY